MSEEHTGSNVTRLQELRRRRALRRLRRLLKHVHRFTFRRQNLLRFPHPRLGRRHYRLMVSHLHRLLVCLVLAVLDWDLPILHAVLLLYCAKWLGNLLRSVVLLRVVVIGLLRLRLLRVLHLALVHLIWRGWPVHLGNLCELKL